MKNLIIFTLLFLIGVFVGLSKTYSDDLPISLHQVEVIYQGKSKLVTQVDVQTEMHKPFVVRFVRNIHRLVLNVNYNANSQVAFITPDTS